MTQIPDTNVVNCHSDLPEWHHIVNGWKPARRTAALYLAIGFAGQDVADRVGQDLRTVQRWCADPVFDAYRQALRALAFTRVEPAIMANVEIALDIQRQMLIGEVAPNDARYQAAERIIRYVVDRLTRPERADAG